MRIGLLTQYYKPEMGAPQNRLFEMIRGLSELGNEVTVITAMPNYPTGKIFQDYKGKFSCEEELDGIKIKRYWLYASNVRKTIPRIWNMLSFTITSLLCIPYLKKKHLDYLIVETPPLTLAWTGRWIAKFIGAKFITNVSDLWPLSARELGAISEGKVYRTLEKLERYIYKKSHITLGQSEEIINYILQHGGENAYLFRNGVDPSRFNSTNAIKVCDEPIKIVYAGLLGFAQGVADICRKINFKELGAEFHIYGDGGERNEIEEILHNNQDNGIFYHGVVSREVLPDILLSCDMSLIPLVKNIYGAVPSKIYESMAAGLPIMFMGEGEGAMIVKDNHLGLVANSKDYNKLKENIIYASSHPKEIEIMAQNCIYVALNKFNRPKQIRELNDFLKEQLNKDF